MSSASHTAAGAVDAKESISLAINHPRDAAVGFGVSSAGGRGAGGLLHCGPTGFVDQADLDELAQVGQRSFFADQAAYRSYLGQEYCRNGRVPPLERYRVLRGITRGVFDMIFHGGKLDDLTRLAEDFGRPLVDVIFDNDLVLADFLALTTHQSSIYSHSINVAAFSLILAKSLGMNSREDLETMATAALLHDIGKRHIEPALLDHPGPLSERQREIVQQHPTRGFKELFLRKDVTWAQLMLVYQHHERIDGQGYPVGLEGDDIHPWARICAIADIFHALISDRPYRRPMPFDQTFDYLARAAGTLVDKDMVECWKATIAPSCC